MLAWWNRWPEEIKKKVAWLQSECFYTTPMASCLQRLLTFGAEATLHTPYARISSAIAVEFNETNLYENHRPDSET